MRRCNRRGFIQLSVALTEIQSDEVDAEFALWFAEAIQEIDGERVFPCIASVRKCARILKVEKRGKTRAALTKEALALIILNWYRSNL
jgi:hypothetical protein